MINTSNCLRVPYVAPEVCSFPLLTDDALCQTSLGAGEIQPGTGENWGNL